MSAAKKKVSSTGRQKSTRRPTTAESPVVLLDPPQIAETIHEYFQSRPDLGDRLWSLVTESGSLLRAWEAFVNADKNQGFWESYWWIPGTPLESSDSDAFREMDTNPRHLMHLCRNSRMLSLACELFDKLAQTNPPAAEFAEALLQHASDVMEQAMDSKRPAAEFWSRDGWWLSQGWQEAALLLADKRDPVHVASWVAPIDPLTAQRCLKTKPLDADSKGIDASVLDLGNNTFQILSRMMESNSELAWTDFPIPQLISLFVSWTNLKHPDNARRLTDLLYRLVPRVFQSAMRDWLKLISDEDLPGFCQSLLYSRTGLQKSAMEFESLRPDRRTKRLVLHIDDEVGVQTLIGIMISRGFGEKVLVASVSGCAGGLILASVLHPDLVLTDVMEPGMDGFTFAKYLKDNPVTSDISLVFLTARVDAEAVIMGIDLGAKKYLSKPILHHDLIAALRSVMGFDPLT